jgi:hypothetical protein
MFSAGTPNNYGGGSAAMQSSMGMRNGALGQRAAAPMEFGGENPYESTSSDYSGWAQQDQSGLGNQYAEGDAYQPAYDLSQGGGNYGDYTTEDTGAYNGADYGADQGGADYGGGYGEDTSWMDQYAGQEGFDPNEYY